MSPSPCSASGTWEQLTREWLTCKQSQTLIVDGLVRWHTVFNSLSGRRGGLSEREYCSCRTGPEEIATKVPGIGLQFIVQREPVELLQQTRIQAGVGGEVNELVQTGPARTDSPRPGNTLHERARSASLSRWWLRQLYDLSPGQASTRSITASAVRSVRVESGVADGLARAGCVVEPKAETCTRLCCDRIPPPVNWGASYIAG